MFVQDAVVGAGGMGAQIAQPIASAAIRVTLRDAEPAALAAAPSGCRG
jgi:3-hydroxyacyl-CoA dehydrogenase